jgi:WhiB family redox-sensing transcriptional regulator
MMESYLERTAWMLRAACQDADPSIFFPNHDRDAHNELGTTTYKEAKTYCDRCPVTRECLLFAMKQFPHNDDDYGMWGGLSPKERRKLRRKTRLANLDKVA